MPYLGKIRLNYKAIDSQPYSLVFRLVALTI